MAEATTLLPLLFGIAAVVAVLLYPNRRTRATAAMVMGALVILLSAAAVTTEITGQVFRTTGSPEPGRSQISLPTATSQPVQPSPAKRHIFVIVMENRPYSDALGSPYLSSLARTFAVATNYHSVSEPSLPNYLAMTSGDTWNIHDDNYHQLPPTGLGEQLTGAGITWKAYSEGFAGDCFTSPYPYALKHNPFAYYGGGCPANIVPIAELAGDLRAYTPALSWIMPGLCNDGHDCSQSTADAWVAQVVPAILASPSWRQGGILFITWDEAGTASDNHVAALVIAPNTVAHQSATYYNHYSLLATIEDQVGVARLGQAVGATAMTDLIR